MAKDPSTNRANKRALAKRWRCHEAFRECEVRYVTDRFRRTIEYWWEQTCLPAKIDLSDLLSRYESGEWRRKRDDYWEAAQQAVIKHSLNRIVVDRVAELERWSAILDEGMDAIAPRVIDGVKVYPVSPNSLEGMLSALTKVSTILEQKREVLATNFGSRLSGDEPDRVITSAFTREERQAATRALLEAKLQSQQKRLEKAASDDLDDNQD